MPRANAQSPAAHELSIRAAVPANVVAIRDLLRSFDLCYKDVEEWLPGFHVATLGGTIIGAAAVECHGEEALLRSVAVALQYRSGGIADALVRRVLARARARAVRAVYLLTLTASRYFPRFGFVEISRDQVPETIRATREFREFCPSSATVMRLIINDETSTQ